MSGDSSRFYNEGYANPKYELTLGDRQVFDYVLDPFLCYQNTLKFLFVVKTPDAADFLLTKMSNLSIQDFEIVNINQSTRGQADTARLGLVDQRKSDPVSIFNIDTIIKEYKPVDFSSPAYSEFSGVLEVFEDDGENWSYIKPDGIDVIEGEKKNLFPILHRTACTISGLLTSIYNRTIDITKEMLGRRLSIISLRFTTN